MTTHRPLVTRADLRNHPAFAGVGADTNGNPCVWTNAYECQDCDTAWEDAWSCRCDDECPDCGAACSPYDSRWIGPGAPELRTLWDALPEAGSPEGDAAIAAAAAGRAETDAANPEGTGERREEPRTDDGQSPMNQSLVDLLIETLELAQERLELNNIQGEETPALAQVADALAKLRAGRQPARREPPLPPTRG